MEQFRDAWGWHRGGALPAWLLSVSLHFTALTTLGLAVQGEPRQATDDRTREGAIVLVARNDGKAAYFSDEVRDQIASSIASDHAEPTKPFPDRWPPPAASGPQLPTAGEPVAAAMPAEGTVTSAARMAPSGNGKAGPLARGQSNPIQTQVFGVRGTGSRFVYVFDRSSSMEGRPLAAAKRELIASLQHLQSVHQFQIIFYNQEPQMMELRERSKQMIFGDEPGRRLAASFVGSILAYGATNHMSALKTALQMQPDVVFFLTDADEPQLRADDFQIIRRLNQGTVINAIEFGVGPPKSRFSFLQQLAAENGGQHTYVDVTRLMKE